MANLLNTLGSVLSTAAKAVETSARLADKTIVAVDATLTKVDRMTPSNKEIRKSINEGINGLVYPSLKGYRSLSEIQIVLSAIKLELNDSSTKEEIKAKKRAIKLSKALIKDFGSKTNLSKDELKDHLSKGVIPLDIAKEIKRQLKI